MRAASRAAVAVALFLLALKAYGWRASGSAALFASLADSGLDLLASALNAWAIERALEPPDREHRHGHGKLEALAGLLQALVICVAAVAAGWQALAALAAPQPLAHGGVAAAVMVVALLVTVALLRLQRRAAAASGSLAIAADSLHYAGDVGQNGAVLLGIAASTWLGWTSVDGFIGVAVALWIARSAWTIAGAAVAHLLDREADDATRDAVMACIASDADVHGVHDLRTRHSGPVLHATAHLAVDGDLTVRAAHAIAEAAEARLLARFPGGHFVLHVDPDDAEDEDPFGDHG